MRNAFSGLSVALGDKFMGSDVKILAVQEILK